MVRETVANVLNLSITTTMHFPSLWKLARVCPIVNVQKALESIITNMNTGSLTGLVLHDHCKAFDMVNHDTELNP